MPRERLLRVLERLEVLVDWERRERRGMNVTLEPAIDLLVRLGDPQRSFRAVHVTGTKGKGTTASLVATALARAGIRTGLYTSPHVERIEERVRVDGHDVESDELALCLEQAFTARDAAVAARSPALDATWFDVLTAAAFLAFQRSKCAWAVVEVGIGGRLDSTNALDGEVAIVTNIDLEHTSLLGRTRAAIAREKGGIVKRGATLVTGTWPDARRGVDEDAGAVLASMAAELDVPVLRPATLAPTLFERDLDLARLALDELGQRGIRDPHGELLSARHLDTSAISAARLPGRQELRYAGRVPVLLDGAHVASSLTALLDECAADPRLPGRPVVVLALGRDKDAPAILKALRSGADRLVCTTVASGPLRAVDTLVEQAIRVGFDAETASDPSIALAKALRHVEGSGWILITGSFHLVGTLRSSLQARPPDTDPRC